MLGKRAITADTDLRLARYFKMSEGFFLGLQNDYELMERKRDRPPVEGHQTNGGMKQTNGGMKFREL